MQPPGESREVRTQVWARQNFIKNKMTGRVDIFAFLREKIIKLKI